MKTVSTWIVLSIALILTTGCDYEADIEGETYSAHYASQSGELKAAQPSGEGIRIFEEEFDPFEGEPIPIDMAPIAECTCDCSANDDACRALPKCDNQAFAVDIRGTCRQQGDQCGGKCECAHCYMPLGKKCGKLSAKPAGVCGWSHP